MLGDKTLQGGTARLFSSSAQQVPDWPYQNSSIAPLFNYSYRLHIIEGAQNDWMEHLPLFIDVNIEAMKN